MREVIDQPESTWDAFNVPERVALTLAHLGSKVLYVETPSSKFRQRSPNELRSVTDQVFGVPRPRLCYLGPAFPDRLNVAVVREIAVRILCVGKACSDAAHDSLVEIGRCNLRGAFDRQMEKAITREPADSPKRQRRLEISGEHSIEKLAEVLQNVLPLE